MVGRIFVPLFVLLTFLGLFLSGLIINGIDLIQLSKISLGFLFLVHLKNQLSMNKLFAKTIALYLLFACYYVFRLTRHEYDNAAHEMITNSLLALTSMSVIYQTGIDRSLFSKIHYICVIALSMAVLTYTDGFEMTKTGRLLFLTRNPNEVSFWLVLGLVSSSFDRHIRSNGFYLIAFLLSLFALIKLNSRGGILLVSILIIDVILQNRKYFYALLLICVVFINKIIAVITSNIYVELLLERVELTRNGDNGGRIKIWKALWELYMENIIFGVGRTQSYNYLMQRVGKAVDAHNMLLSILIEYGACGLLIITFWYFNAVHKYVMFTRRNILMSLLVFIHAMKAGGVMYSYVFAIFLLILLVHGKKEGSLSESTRLQ